METMTREVYVVDGEVYLDRMDAARAELDHKLAALGLALSIQQCSILRAYIDEIIGDLERYMIPIRGEYQYSQALNCDELYSALSKKKLGLHSADFAILTATAETVLSRLKEYRTIEREEETETERLRRLIHSTPT